MVSSSALFKVVRGSVCQGASDLRRAGTRVCLTHCKQMLSVCVSVSLLTRLRYTRSRNAFAHSVFLSKFRLAILGLTSQYLSSSITTEAYHDLASLLSSDVRALNPSLPNAVGSGANASGGLAGKAADADDGRIRVLEQELRFTLYRHWSLENAMYHSAYVAGKLSMWRAQGVGKLRQMMAKMG